MLCNEPHSFGLQIHALVTFSLWSKYPQLLVLVLVSQLHQLDLISISFLAICWDSLLRETDQPTTSITQSNHEKQDFRVPHSTHPPKALLALFSHDLSMYWFTKSLVFALNGIVTPIPQCFPQQGKKIVSSVWEILYIDIVRKVPVHLGQKIQPPTLCNYSCERNQIVFVLCLHKPFIFFLFNSLL